MEVNTQYDATCNHHGKIPFRPRKMLLCVPQKQARIAIFKHAGGASCLAAEANIVVVSAGYGQSCGDRDHIQIVDGLELLGLGADMMPQ